MRKYLLAFILGIASVACNAQKIDETNYKVVLETNFGKVKLVLYNETPKHRDNFLKLVSEGFYDGILFHRVINNFMIQAGDPASKTAEPGQKLGGTKEPYTLKPEFVGFKHKKGTLAAARQATGLNPEKKSSAYQFYIVTRPNCPHLDVDGYTIFGEVIDGMGYIQDIQGVQTDANDRPVEDVKIIKATIIEPGN